MAKVTNTTDELFYVGGVEIKPHSTSEITDDVLAYAKNAKGILRLFAIGDLAEGDLAERREAAIKDNPPYTGPAASVHPPLAKPPRSHVKVEVKKSAGTAPPPPKPQEQH